MLSGVLPRRAWEGSRAGRTSPFASHARNHSPLRCGRVGGGRVPQPPPSICQPAHQTCLAPPHPRPCTIRGPPHRHRRQFLFPLRNRHPPATNPSTSTPMDASPTANDELLSSPVPAATEEEYEFIDNVCPGVGGCLPAVWLSAALRRLLSISGVRIPPPCSPPAPCSAPPPPARPCRSKWRWPRRRLPPRPRARRRQPPRPRPRPVRRRLPPRLVVVVRAQANGASPLRSSPCSLVFRPERAEDDGRRPCRFA